jgi:hypothetical protein
MGFATDRPIVSFCQTSCWIKIDVHLGWEFKTKIAPGHRTDTVRGTQQIVLRVVGTRDPKVQEEMSRVQHANIWRETS